MPFDDVNTKLKKLTRRRKQLVQEKVALISRFSTELQGVAPDLKLMTTAVDNLWFLRFVTLKEDIRDLIRVHSSTMALLITRAVFFFSKNVLYPLHSTMLWLRAWYILLLPIGSNI